MLLTCNRYVTSSNPDGGTIFCHYAELSWPPSNIVTLTDVSLCKDKLREFKV